MADDDYESEIEDEKVPKFELKVNHEAKLKELLHKINSIEIKLCSDATKEFIKLLKADSGGEFLRYYVRSSPRCSELLDAWKLRRGKSGLSYIFRLISAVLSHDCGKYRPNDKEGIGISRVLDKCSKLIIEEYMQDVYKEMNSRETKSQNAVLKLMASVVRRGSGLASDVAKSFDFKLKGFSKLAGYKRMKNEKRVKGSSRRSFVEFAMSFLEVGKPGLLRWVLQQREMYSGVLRGLGNDDDETAVYVLSTLRDRILVEASLVPPGLRSVLFGSATLEQLVEISGRENGGSAAELAYNVLVLVCIDPCNGLMPDPFRRPRPLKGNMRRLLDLMKKLRATEIVYHRDLLLAIVSGRPSFGAAYMEEFPYNLEDYASPNWFAIVTLAANLVSSVGKGLKFDFLASQSHDQASSHSGFLQNVMKCLCPRSFSRSVINKGLLHLDFLVKHGTLRLLSEELKLLNSLMGALNSQSCSCSKDVEQDWASIKQEIQNEVRALLPDPQVLLTLLSSLSSQSKTRELSLKRKSKAENFPEHGKSNVKRLKNNVVDSQDSDIIVGGINFCADLASHEESEKASSTPTADEFDPGKDIVNVLQEIWGPDLGFMTVSAVKEAETYFQSKLLDALKTYFQVLPTALEGSFEFLINLLTDPLALHTNLQRSLLSLLIEYVRWSPTGIPISSPLLMYKHLQSFMSLLIFSPISDIKNQAYDLAQAAMLSTGAFDRNRHEIGSWFLFLPGYDRRKPSFHVPGVEALQRMCQVVISFLCDAISTVGNNLFKYWDIVQRHTCNLKVLKDASPDFSPLVVCILQKCIRLLDSESGTFTLPEKSMISLYVCDTLKYILQTQVDARLLSAVIDAILLERVGEHGSVTDDSEAAFCEWRPLKNLLLFSRSILHQQACIFSIDKKAKPDASSFGVALSEVKRSLRNGNDDEIAGITKAFSSSIICATPKEILNSFPTVMSISKILPSVPAYLMPSLFFLEQTLLTSVSNFWPEVFFAGLEMTVSSTYYKDRKDDACGATDYALAMEEMVGTKEFDTNEAASAAFTFSFFLKQAPFHVLFPSIMSTDGPYSSEPTKIKDLLLAKLSEWKFDGRFVSYLRLLLFWIHQIQSSYRVSPAAKLQELSEICFVLLKDLLVQLLDIKIDSDCPRTSRVLLSTQEIQEVAVTIFCHPAVETSISRPLGCDVSLAKANLLNSIGSLTNSSRQSVHKLDHHILDMLVRTSEYLFSLCDDHHFEVKVKNVVGNKLVKVVNMLIQMILKEVKEGFDRCISTGDLIQLLQPYYALHAMIHFASPVELLELVQWMFKRVNVDKLTDENSNKTSPISFGFCIAVGAFRNLSAYLMQPLSKRRKYDMLWDVEENKNVNIVEEIYIQVTWLAMHFETEYADMCLLEAVNAAQMQKFRRHHSFHRLSLVMSRVIMNTSVKILPHCTYRTTMTKAKLLFLLTDMSSLHLSIFGDLFLSLVNKDLVHRGNKAEESRGFALSDEEYMMLLPTALSYLNSSIMKFGLQNYKHFRSIPSFYSTILLKGFRDWKSFVSSDVFWEEYGNFLPTSTQELLILVNDSLLGKAIRMLQFHFALDGGSMKMKKRLKLFNSIFPVSTSHEELVDSDFIAADSCSLNQALNLINRVLAKISLCRVLLFPNCNQIQSIPKEDGGLKETPWEMGSTKEDCSGMDFVKILVGLWQSIVKKFPLVSGSYKKRTDIVSLFRYLEAFILQSILELTTEMHGSLIQLESIPFLEQLMKSALRYRFEDPTTLKMLQGILTVLSEGKFSRDFYLQLLLAHSQFESTIHSVSNSTNCSHIGAFLRPLPGVLRHLVFPTADKNTSDGNHELETMDLYLKQLGVIKLLRVLFSFKSHQSASDFGKSLGIKFRKLHLLLLSSYGAKLNEMDMEIYNLMSTIESFDGLEAENIAGLDHLWGTAASKVEKEQALEQDIMNDAEAVKERRRSQFRENLPVDPKICASTVLYFPYDRTASHEPVSLDKFRADNFACMIVNYTQTRPSDVENLERYDPVFILRFSLYSLTVGYIEPMEFAGLGLLAIAFVSMSSPDEGIRKLAYSTLGKFKDTLEQCKKRKEVTRIRLLLSSLQNGIEEPWQRIPSVVSIFAAEASFILLDPSHDQYSTLSRLLMNSSKLNLKNVPVFSDFFWSTSVNYRADRLWILRLVYAGLNSSDDAQIYIRNSIPETFMSFYFSPLSDTESKDLILQVVKRSVKFYKLTRHLVESCGLLLWLSSVLTANTRNSRDETNIFIMQLTVVLEVVNGVISSRNITEWLQKEALEQLMELVSHLYRFLVDGMVSVKEHATLVNLLLETLISTLKISQKRKIYQPHFNLSIEGLYQICEVLSTDDDVITCANAEFGLKAILMSTPPAAIFSMSQEKLSRFLMWAVSSALQAECAKSPQSKLSQQSLSFILEEEQHEDSLLSKLLRWLTASVILGKLVTNSNDLDPKTGSSVKDLLSSLDHVETACEESNQNGVGREEFLASTILFLQRLVGTNHKVLPSVVSALSILLLHAFNLADVLRGHGLRSLLESLWSRICPPAEANPSWRWSFYQPWKDLSLELTDSQKLDELHACQTLLFVMSNVLGSMNSESLRSLTEDVRKIDSFEREKGILGLDECNNWE
ncbi:hypothetical protein L484_017832 [Morus notabilis]|uniref:Nucleolar pre-ribosomal-associated protein 1 N-terminal domain-containing protein n=2 Tax=Morus notabilis TaxID=981085 RepID=W9R0E8_9ROSA|nr:hypothetical protein L484_017832 [Morus notabilis]